MSAPCCKHCGWPLEATAPTIDQIVGSIRLSPLERRIMAPFARHVGKWLPVETLTHALYADRHGEHPADPGRAAAHVVKRLRRRLATTPLAIESIIGRGNHERRLVWRREGPL